ncbi:MAG: hypothetical protein E7464_00110 [Ruminococcaceae bacterium]|nr:hypothetical protein [Oscillospiraceae bacterium]
MKTRKRLLLLCLIFALLMSALPVKAAETELRYEIRNGAVWITGPQDHAGALVIPEEIEGMPVAGIAARAFYDNSGITSVTLPENLRYIEEAAFHNCTGIREPVLIPDGLEWIWPDAFFGTTITGKKYSAAERYSLLSQNQRFIQSGSLPNCRGVWDGEMFFWIRNGEAELVYFNANIYNILLLPETVRGYPVTSIGAFAGVVHERGSADLKYVVIPGSVKTVGAYAFYESCISSFFLCEGVEELKDYALHTCVHNTSLYLPSTLQTLAEHAFSSRPIGFNNETVYAFPETPAYEKALDENCAVNSRIDADGRMHGFYAGLRFIEENEEITITSATNRSLREIPAEIDGLPVTALHFEGFASYEPVTIPPSVTSIVDEDHDMRNHTCYVWPGSYAESYCRKMGYDYESVFTAKGVPFADVPENRWYYEAVCYVYNTGLMSGVSDSCFAPEDTTSRAMLVTVLWRLAGCPEASVSAAFKDVSAGSWYERAVNWAAEQGIVQGVSADRFAPDIPVTREQIATILLRYANHQGLDDGRRSNVSGFPDAKTVSPWAMEGIQWAKANGIITGQLKNNDAWLNPLAGAKRSEIAIMLMRFSL